MAANGDDNSKGAKIIDLRRALADRKHEEILTLVQRIDDAQTQLFALVLKSGLLSADDALRLVELGLSADDLHFPCLFRDVPYRAKYRPTATELAALEDRLARDPSPRDGDVARRAELRDALDRVRHRTQCPLYEAAQAGEVAACGQVNPEFADFHPCQALGTLLRQFVGRFRPPSA